MLHQLSSPTYSTASVPDRFLAESLEPARGLVTAEDWENLTGEPNSSYRTSNKIETLIFYKPIKLQNVFNAATICRMGIIGAFTLFIDVEDLNASFCKLLFDS